MAAVTAVVLASPATAAAKRQRCHSRACETRVQHKHRRHVIRPYRGWLAHVRRCESGGRYRTATGNGYWGAYQMDLRTWASVGGHGYPHQAGRLEQDYRAVVLRLRRGTAPWPICG